MHHDVMGRIVYHMSFLRLLLGWAFGLFTSIPALAQHPQWSTADVARLVHKQERCVRFISGEAFKATVCNEGGVSRRGGEVQLTFLLEMKAGGRTRLDYELQSVQHSDTKKWALQKLSSGFDGSVTWVWDKRFQFEGADEHAEPRSATVESGRKIMSWGKPETAFFATLPGYYDWREMSFLDGLKVSGAPWTVSWDGTTEQIVLTLPAKSGGREMWRLAKVWAYALQSYQRVDAKDVVVSEFEVLEAVPLHPDFWYPKKIRGSGTVGRTGSDRNHYTIDVLRVEALDAVDETLFEPRFPHGTVVTNLDTKEQVRLAAPDAQLGQTLDEQAKQMRELVLYDVPKGMAWWQVALAVAMGLAGISLLARRPRADGRRRRRAATGAVAWPLLAALACATPATAQKPSSWAMQRLPGAKADNCAVNAVALSLAFFSRPRGLQGIAEQLGCGPERLEPVALDRIRACLLDSGLAAEAVRLASLADARQVALECSGVVLLHVATGGDVPHYFLVAPGAEEVVIADPGVGVRRQALHGAYARRIDTGMTGLGLRIFQRQTKGVQVLQSEDAWEVPLGVMPAGECSIQVSVANHGPEALVLEAAKSDCGCFVRAECVPATLPPWGEGVLRFVVDSGRLGVVAKSQTVHLAFRSGAGSWSRLVRLVGSRAAESAPPAKACIAPALVRSVLRPGAGCSGSAVVLVPSGGRVVEWRGPPGVQALPGVMDPVTGGVAVRYSLSWPGERAWIEFAVQDGDGAVQMVHCLLDERCE